jgi:peptide/nickel transport system permease protein
MIEEKSIKYGFLIITSFILLSLLTPFIVPEERVKYWNDGNYWIKNPKLAPPKWYNYFTSKDRTPTEILTPKQKKIENFNSLRMYNFSFEYDYTYYVPPQDIWINLNVNSSNALYEVSFIRPDRINILLLQGEVQKGEISLKTRQEVRKTVMNFAMEKLDVKTFNQLTFNPFEYLFSSKSGNPLKGVYRIDVVIYSFNQSDVIEEPSIRIVGSCYGILGTDNMGRDLFVGFIWAMRNTLFLALFVALFTVFFGTLFGLITGYIDSRLSKALEFVNKVFLALPVLPTALIITYLISVQSVGKSVELSTFEFSIILSALLWGKPARSIKAIVEQEKVQEYVTVAESIGASKFYILRRHILKKVLPYSFAVLSITVPKVIVLISLFGFFGIVPGINWGSFMAEALERGGFYGGVWWWIIPPGLAIALIGIGFVLINKGIEKWLGI